jgi:rare lipoprotein A
MWCVLLCGITAGCATPLPPSQPPVQTAIPPSRPDLPKPYKVLGQWYQPLPDARGFRQTGIASWYGRDFHGKKTSNGEIYDMYAESAAHKTLPLGTIVLVRNLENGQELPLRINDRGPFVAGRIIDLSYAAAQKLGVAQPGTARVEVVAIGTSATETAQSSNYYYTGNFTIQVGAFRNRDNAVKLHREMNARYHNAHIVTVTESGEPFYRVRVARCTTLEEAESYESHFRQSGFSEAFAVAE